MESGPGQPGPESLLRPETANGVSMASHTANPTATHQLQPKIVSGALGVAPGAGAPGVTVQPAEISRGSEPATAQSNAPAARVLPPISTLRQSARQEGETTGAGDGPQGEPTGQNQTAEPGQNPQATTQIKSQASDAVDNDGSPAPQRDAVKEENSGEAGTSGRNTGEETVGIVAGRRSSTIKPKDMAGSVVWAKLAKYPWWPAQVLDEADPWIPSDSEPPRRGAIPVRFFGTYDFAWIESHRAICPFDQDFEEHSSKSKQKSFTDALEEASRFQKTQELPDGFNEDSTPSPQKAPRKGKAVAGASRSKSRMGGPGGRGTKRGGGDSGNRRSVRERQDGIMQQLALVPPPDSPFSHTICLDGVRKLMELQAAGQYPPPAPAAAPAYTQPPPFSGGFGQAFPMPQLTPQQLQQFQQLQLHLQQQQQMQYQQQAAAGAAAGQPPRPQWPPPFQGYNPQVNFFQQAGGVQGALLAAANQNQLQPKQF